MKCLAQALGHLDTKQAACQGIQPWHELKAPNLLVQFVAECEGFHA